MSSLWSVRIWVKSANLPTWSISAWLFSPSSSRTSDSAWFNVPRVSSRFAELSASTCDTDATWLVNCTICSLLFDSASTSTCRLRTVPNRSLRESPRRPAVCDSSRTASRNESPLPSNVVAAWSMTSANGPCTEPCCGPSWALSWVSCSLTSSHSTGTAVRSRPIAAPSAIVGPPV